MSRTTLKHAQDPKACPVAHSPLPCTLPPSWTLPALIPNAEPTFSAALEVLHPSHCPRFGPNKFLLKRPYRSGRF